MTSTCLSPLADTLLIPPTDDQSVISAYRRPISHIRLTKTEKFFPPTEDQKAISAYRRPRKSIHWKNGISQRGETCRLHSFVFGYVVFGQPLIELSNLCLQPPSGVFGIQLDSLEKSVLSNAGKRVDFIPTFLAT